MELNRRSRAPEMKRVDYWKLKSQAAAAESAADTYPYGRYNATGCLINRSRNP
jgi:hypothetical protein